MSKLVWDKESERLYETGVNNGVLYTKDKNGAYSNGVAWNGLTGVTDNPTGAESTALYADNIKYLNLRSAEEYKCTIEAYTYPDEFMPCDGSAELAKGVTIGQQPRKQFGFSYRTVVGNDTEGESYGYKIHLVYGCDAAPSSKGYNTINDNPDAITFSWEVSTTPVNVKGFKPTATVVIDSTATDPDKMQALLEILYGTDATVGDDAAPGTDPRLPLPDEILSLVGTTEVAG